MAIIPWSGLLLNGLWRLVTLDHHLRFRSAGSMLAFEVLLHMLYGEETFVYSFEFHAPLAVAAWCLPRSTHRYGWLLCSWSVSRAE